MLIDEANGRIGAAANGCGDVKDTTTLASQSGSTCLGVVPKLSEAWVS